MYIPDHTIVRRLRKFDADLSVLWDSHRERWVVFQKHGRGKRLLHVVRNGDGSYRPLDSRLLDDLRRARWQAQRNREHIAHLEEEMRKAHETREKDHTNELEAITAEIAPRVRREASEQAGAVNIPKEDVKAQLKASLRPETQEVMGI